MELKKQEILTMLDDAGIAYEVASHAPVYTIDELLALHLPRAEVIAKNLFVRDDKKRNYYLISVREEKKVDLKSLQEKIAARRLSFASENDLNAILGLQTGAVSPFGMLNDRECKVKLLLDMAFRDGFIGIHPNENTATVWLKTADLIGIIQQHGNSVELISL